MPISGVSRQLTSDMVYAAVCIMGTFKFSKPRLLLLLTNSLLSSVFISFHLIGVTGVKHLRFLSRMGLLHTSNFLCRRTKVRGSVLCFSSTQGSRLVQACDTFILLWLNKNVIFVIWASKIWDSAIKEQCLARQLSWVQL